MEIRKRVAALVIAFLALVTLPLQSGAADEKFQRGKTLYDEKRYEEAYPYFVSEAEEGNDRAMMHLGKMFFNGWGVKHNHDTAKLWHEKAAELGNEESKEKLLNFTHNVKKH